MGAVLDIIDINTQLPVTQAHRPVWESASDNERTLASARQSIVKEVLAIVSTGVSSLPACELLVAEIKMGVAAKRLLAIARRASVANKNYPSAKTIQRWLSDFDRGGVEALLPARKGRQRKDYGWEVRALYWQQKPSKMLPGAIAQVLCAEEFEVTGPQVRRWLKTLPDDVRNKKRMGNKFYRDTQMPSKLRDTTVLRVGEVYQGDGHTIDVYLAHPETGNPWRFELTVWMDIRSRYIAGFFLTEAESANSTLLALSKAMINHDHIPDCLHIDNGSGYKSHMMTDEVTGFYSRFNIKPMFAWPGNSKGKGQIERFFRTLRDSFDKRWDSYCGHDMADEAIQKVLKKVRQKKGKLPDSRDYVLALQDWIEEYHHKPHRGLDGQTPAELWKQLEKNPLHMSAAEVVRPRKQCYVRRGSINFDKREYRHPELQAFNKSKIIIEYDLFSDASIVALTIDGRKICEPTLTKKIDYLPASRLDEHTQRRVAGQKKRLQKKMDEADARSRHSIDVAQLATQILDDGHTVDAIEHGTTLLPTDDTDVLPEATPNDDIDIYDTDY